MNAITICRDDEPKYLVCPWCQRLMLRQVSFDSPKLIEYRCKCVAHGVMIGHGPFYPRPPQETQ